VRPLWSAVFAGLTIVLAASASAEAGAAATPPPETAITAGPTGPTGDSSPSFAFGSNESDASFECSLDGTGFTACSSPQSYASVTESPHTFAVRAVDAAGNVDPTPAQHSFTVDASVNAVASAARNQDQDGGEIKVAVRVDAGESLTAVANGKIALGKDSFALRSVRERLRAGRDTLTLRPEKSKAARSIAKALSQGASARARVTVDLADTLGNELEQALRVRLSAP
jgi:hypothetical protein